MSNIDTNQNVTARRSVAATIDAMGWGVFFIWIGVALVVDTGWGIALLGMGAISLGVQLVRRLLAPPVDLWSVGVGLCLVLAGLLQWLNVSSLGAALAAWAIPAVFVVAGVSIIFSAWRRMSA